MSQLAILQVQAKVDAVSADDVRLIVAAGAVLLALLGMAGGLWYRMGRLEGRLDALAESQRAESEARRAESEARRADTARIVSRIDRLFELRGTAPDSGDDD